MRRVIEVTECRYPETDGKPMGETDMQRNEMVRHVELLRRYFEGQRVYVSGDLLVYYEQGNPKKFVVPDAFVVKGVRQSPRRIYKIWEEGHAPHVIIETTSRKTRKRDMIVKPELYRKLGVKEYFLFDPEGDYLDPTLQGYRLDGVDYQRLAYGNRNGGNRNGLWSEELQLTLFADAGILHFYRLDGSRLLTFDESCDLEAEARQLAEAEVRRLREELDRLRGS
jgi:Uma2 family endonuclease